MNQTRKTKKIEIEIYEDAEADFLLSLLNSSKKEIYKDTVINSIAIPFDKHKNFIDDAIIPVCNNTKKSVRRFWIHFKEMSLHKNSKIYGDIIGDTFNSFFEKKISVILILIHGLWCALKELQNKISREDEKYILASLSNSIFDYYFSQSKLKEAIINSSNAEENAKAIFENRKYLKNEEYQFTKIEVITPFGKCTMNEIYKILVAIFLYIETGQQLEGEQDLEFDIIKILYQELKRDYDISDYATNIITGFVLSELGFLKNKKDHEKQDTQSSWKDYLRNSVENKVRCKMVVDKDKIIFVGKPLINEQLGLQYFLKNFKSIYLDILLLKRAENKAKMSILSE